MMEGANEEAVALRQPSEDKRECSTWNKRLRHEEKHLTDLVIPRPKGGQQRPQADSKPIYSIKGTDLRAQRMLKACTGDPGQKSSHKGGTRTAVGGKLGVPVTTDGSRSTRRGQCTRQSRDGNPSHKLAG
jgi:hypothetical protein